MNRNEGDPNDEDLHDLLAQAAGDEVAPRRSSVRSAMKRLRLRRHGIEHVNESFGGVGQLLRGLKTLWSVEDDPNG